MQSGYFVQTGTTRLKCGPHVKSWTLKLKTTRSHLNFFINLTKISWRWLIITSSNSMKIITVKSTCGSCILYIIRSTYYTNKWLIELKAYPLPIPSPTHFYWIIFLTIPYPNEVGKGMNMDYGYPPIGISAYYLEHNESLRCWSVSKGFGTYGPRQ